MPGPDERPRLARERRKGSARAVQAGRARLLIRAGRGWLGGHPGPVSDGQVAWRGGLVDSIDRAALATATRATKQLHREHAAVLPLVLGDVAAWDAGVATALRTLKATIHDGAA